MIALCLRILDRYAHYLRSFRCAWEIACARVFQKESGNSLLYVNEDPMHLVMRQRDRLIWLHQRLHDFQLGIFRWGQHAAIVDDVLSEDAQVSKLVELPSPNRRT